MFSESTFSDVTVVVAGASLTDREVILHALGDGCHVVAAQSVDAALAHAADPVALVISDIKTHEVNGLELMRRWKLRQPTTPFLMLAEGDDLHVVVEAMKAGAADCVAKPVDEDELRSAALQLIRPATANPHMNGGAGGNGSAGGPRRKDGLEIPPDTSLEDLERAAVEQALVQHHGNRTHAARTLGISVRTLQRKLKAWGLPLLSSVPRNGVMGHSFLVSTEVHAPSTYSTHVH